MLFLLQRLISDADGQAPGVESARFLQPGRRLGVLALLSSLVTLSSPRPRGRGSIPGDVVREHALLEKTEVGVGDRGG